LPISNPDYFRVLPGIFAQKQEVGEGEYAKQRHPQTGRIASLLRAPGPSSSEKAEKEEKEAKGKQTAAGAAEIGEVEDEGEGGRAQRGGGRRWEWVWRAVDGGSWYAQEHAHTLDMSR
jgi:hypothetical protein